MTHLNDYVVKSLGIKDIENIFLKYGSINDLGSQSKVAQRTPIKPFNLVTSPTEKKWDHHNNRAFWKQSHSSANFLWKSSPVPLNNFKRCPYYWRVNNPVVISLIIWQLPVINECTGPRILSISDLIEKCRKRRQPTRVTMQSTAQWEILPVGNTMNIPLCGPCRLSIVGGGKHNTEGHEPGTSKSQSTAVDCYQNWPAWPSRNPLTKISKKCQCNTFKMRARFDAESWKKR